MADDPRGLFEFIGPPPAPKLKGSLGWLARIKRRFSFFVLLSLIAHLALFGMVVILRPRSEAPSSQAAVRGQDLQIFKEALRAYATDGRTPERLASALMGLSESEVEEAFRQAPVLDYRLSAKEKAGWYEIMFAQASTEFKEGPGEGPSALDLPLSRYFGGLREMPLKDPGGDYELVRIDDPLEEGARLYRLSKGRAETLDSLIIPAGGSMDRADEVNLMDESGRLLTVPGEYFYRDSPYVQIAAAGAELFYIVKGFPELPSARSQDGPIRTVERGASDVPIARSASDPSTAPFLVFLVPKNTSDDPAPATAAPTIALALPEREIGRVLDRLMSLPVAEQVRSFHKDYLDVYDPDSPDLARLTGEFVFRNLGMVFVQTGDPLSRGFDLLEELFYDNRSLDALVPYALKHPRSRTGAEILLGLAAAYEFERRAIIAMDGALVAARTVLMGSSGDRLYVHNKNVKAYVLREVYRDLAVELRGLEYPSLETVLQRYRDEQIGLYDGLMEMSGEVKCRAQYALGRLFWDEGRTELALETWRNTDPAYADETLIGIRGAIMEKMRPLDAVPRIDDLLGRQTAAMKSELLTRIAKFHKWEQR